MWVWVAALTMSINNAFVETHRALSRTLKANWTTCSVYKTSRPVNSMKRLNSSGKSLLPPPQKISLVFLLLSSWILRWVTLDPSQVKIRRILVFYLHEELHGLCFVVIRLNASQNLFSIDRVSSKTLSINNSNLVSKRLSCISHNLSEEFC